MKTKISKVFYFDAAHRIANHKGKCKNLHGHTYKLIVTIEGEIESGMVIDAFMTCLILITNTLSISVHYVMVVTITCSADASM